MELVINKQELNVFYGSDFHADFWRSGIKPFTDRVDVDKFDLFLFAGDVSEWNDGNCRKIYDVLMAAGKPVIMIPGNHEFYGGQYQLIMEEIGEYSQRHPNFYFLDKNYVDLPVQKVRIWGDTFWTDFRGCEEARRVARRVMNDYRQIIYHRNTGGIYLEPEDTVVMNDKARTALFKHYHATPEDWKFLVMTHHAPFPMSTPKAYCKPEYTDTAKLNKAYSNDLYEWCCNADVYPEVWIHGHIHDPVHYEVEFEEEFITKVISNPFGYPGERDHDTISRHWLKLSSNGILMV